MTAPGLALLEALLETGSVTAAAKACGVSQPTVTRAMARWEAATGAELFDRSRRSIDFTPMGLGLASSARSALEMFRAALRADTPPPDRSLVVGSLRSLGRTIVSEIIAAYINEHGPTAVRLVEGSSADVADGVRSGTFEVGVTVRPADLGRCVWHTLGRQSLSLVLPVGHTHAARPSVDLREFSDSRFVALDSRFNTREYADALCAEAGFRPDIVLESDDAARLRHYVGEGIGVAILPADLSINPRVEYVRIASRLAIREFGFLVSARRALSPEAAGLLEHVRALGQKYPGWADLLDH